MEPRKSDKSTDEAVAVSTHLIINTANVGTEDDPLYNAVLEEMPGISKSHVLSLLSKMLKEHPYDFTDGRGESKNTHCIIGMKGIPSEALGGAVAGARVPGITLIRTANTDGLDHGGVLVPQSEKMRVSFKATSDPIGWINRVKAWGRDRGWTHFRVDIDMPEKRSRTVSLTREDDAASVLFVRSVPVDLSRPIETCSHTIVEELVDHAVSII